MLDFSNSLNDVLGFLSAYNAMPMSSTAQAGYNLANTSLSNKYNLAGRTLDLQSLAEKNAMEQFNSQLAMAKAAQQWQQMMGNKQFNAAQNQQQWQNTWGNLEPYAMTQSSGGKGPDYYLQQANTLSDNGVISPNNLADYYYNMSMAGIPAVQSPVVAPRRGY